MNGRSENLPSLQERAPLTMAATATLTSRRRVAVSAGAAFFLCSSALLIEHRARVESKRGTNRRPTGSPAD
jgi:hypothetical protein